jgi:hypothetical protein
LATNFPPHCRRIAAQRAAGEAFAGTLNEQLKPSALRFGLPAAKAALDTLMQQTSSAAATISMISLMASPSVNYSDIAAFRFAYITKADARMPANRPGPCIKSYQRIAQRYPAAGFDPGARRV